MRSRTISSCRCSTQSILHRAYCTSPTACCCTDLQVGRPQQPTFHQCDRCRYCEQERIESGCNERTGHFLETRSILAVQPQSTRRRHRQDHACQSHCPGSWSDLHCSPVQVSLAAVSSSLSLVRLPLLHGRGSERRLPVWMRVAAFSLPLPAACLRLCARRERERGRVGS